MDLRSVNTSLRLAYTTYDLPIGVKNFFRRSVDFLHDLKFVR